MVPGKVPFEWECDSIYNLQILSRCEMLMDLGYIKRDTENPQLVSYVPEGLPVHSRRSSEKEKDSDNAQPNKGDEDLSQVKK